MDGFVLTHAVERLDVPEQGVIDKYLPPYAPGQVLDPGAPLSIGAMVGPEAYTEVRYLAHHRIEAALQRFPELARNYAKLVGRRAEDLARGYRLRDARTVFVAMGSVIGTLEDAVDEARDAGLAVGAVELTCFRPFPSALLRELLADAEHVVVLERALSVGSGGIVTAELAAAGVGEGMRLTTVIAGLGGRPVTRKALRRLIADTTARRVPALSFLDLDHELLRRTHAKENGR
jgi:pyruvate ferredoxin oxidoreductase alpha subunit